MKKIGLILAIFTVFLSFSPATTTVRADETKTYYAKILNSNAYFYSSPTSYDDAKLFVIPSSYFVLLLDNAGEDFYYAKYLDLYGYVKKNEVTPMDGTPTNPYANSTFRNFSPNGLSVYSRPKSDAEILGSLNFLQTDITLYGEIIGEELFENSTNTWFYCSTTQNGNKITGYAFSYYCDIVTRPSENTEYFPEITGELVFSNSLSDGGGLSDTAIAIIILAVSLPCLVVLYLLLSPSKRKVGKKTEKVKTVKRGKDYYEFNEDDLT